MKYQYDKSFCIMRAQPLHNGHAKIINTCFQLAENVTIFIGSASSPRTTINPLSSDERYQIIRQYVCDEFGEEGLNRVSIQELDDIYGDDPAWFRQIRIKMGDTTNTVLVGSKKPDTVRYLSEFVDIPYVDIPQMITGWSDHDSAALTLNATMIREDIYKNRGLVRFQNQVPKATREFMKKQVWNTFWKPLADSWNHEIHYEDPYRSLPHGVPIFNTVDAVVVCRQHVLMVQRSTNPGFGLWALPGGFQERGETIKAGIIRELVEETSIRNVDETNISAVEYFDHPNRDPRGHFITHAGLIVLDRDHLPRVREQKGEVRRCKWFPNGTLQQRDCFADHYGIIQTMLKKIR